MNTRFIKYLKKFTRVGKILIVFLVPLILALPGLPPPWNTHVVKVQLSNGEPANQEKYSFLTESKALGATYLSTILSIPTKSMPNYVCLMNTSKVIDAEGKKMDRSELLEDKEAGSIIIPFFRDDAMDSMHIAYASSTCIYPNAESGHIEFGNQVQVRGFSPFGKAELQVINEQPVIALRQYPGLTTIFNMEGKTGYVWRWEIYRENYFLFLIGWIILLSSAIQVYSWCRNKDTGIGTCHP